MQERVSADVQVNSNKQQEKQNYLDMYLEDAPLTVLLGEIHAGIKSIVNTHLFKGVKYYHNSQSPMHVVGYVLDKIHKGGLENKAFWMSMWNAACNYISFQTAELWQQCIERWYAVLYGKFIFWKHFILI